MVKRRLSESISAASPSVIRATASVLHNPAQIDQRTPTKAGTEQYNMANAKVSAVMYRQSEPSSSDIFLKIHVSMRRSQ